ncbi:MAG TPA: helix-turn-helix domain-containing protein [Vicinamibacterales bacterium]|jgi:hypothetical protein|nr:helix-turn-helix domain-containing protein [Vicinamibacterales bacterium]
MALWLVRVVNEAGLKPCRSLSGESRLSIAAIGYAFTLPLPSNEKWLLVCLADYADDWGESIFPSLDTLESKSGMSRATLRRTFAKLLKDKHIEQLCESTAISPSFYRIADVPIPRESENSHNPQCPIVLRRAAVLSFGQRCEFCRRGGTKDLGPDDRPWVIYRLPAARSGIYSPDVVTLACRTCNSKKREALPIVGARSLKDVIAQNKREREKGCQVGTPCNVAAEPAEGYQLDTSPFDEGSQGESSGDTTVTPQGSHGATGEGVNLIPDPSKNLCTDPSLIRSSAGATSTPRRSAVPERPEKNLDVITVLAHEVLHLVGDDADPTHVSESVKDRCARLHIAYDSAVVGKAIDSATWQRANGYERAERPRA